MLHACCLALPPGYVAMQYRASLWLPPGLSGPQQAWEECNVVVSAQTSDEIAGGSAAIAYHSARGMQA